MAQLPQVGGDFGRYRVVSRLGMGGMGVVYVAADSRLQDRRVALKVISSQFAETAEFAQRFEREAQVMARVSSPNVVEVFDYGTHDGSPYLASQLVPGGDLGTLLRTRGPVPPQLAARICAQVAHALDAAHRAGVVHRDVKPSNVLLHDPDAERLHAYLCDFGIAQPDDMEGLTQTGGIAGSWGYLAPERGQGHPATPASDLYAVGCLLWACLSGVAPYAGSDVQVAMAHAQAPIPQLPGTAPVTVELNRILRSAMAKAPADRPASGRQLCTDLLAVSRLPSEGFQAPPAHVVDATAPRGATAHTAPPRRKRALLVGTGILALALAGGGATWWLTRADSPATAEASSGVTSDYDGDGLGDFAFASPTEDLKAELVVLPSTGKAFESEELKAETWGLMDGLVGDLDGDGDSEIVSVSGTGRETVATVRSGDGTQERSVVPFQRNAIWGTNLLGDFTGDGLADLAHVVQVGRAPDSFRPNIKDTFQLELWVAARGDDGFARPTLWASQSGWAWNGRDFRVGDFDGDGADDVAVLWKDGYEKRPGTLHLLRSTRSAFTVQPYVRKLPVEGIASSRLGVGDFNDDGRDDLVALAVDGASIVSWRSTGFGEAVSWFDGTSPAFRDPSLSVADYDGDGKDDLGVVGPAGGPDYDVSVLRSEGSKFAEPETWAEFTSPGTGDNTFLFPIGGNR